MRELLDNALRSGDVLSLESAIISAQNCILSSSNPRQESGRLSDVLLKARKALVQYLEKCGPLLKPLRRACRNFDEKALADALRKIYLAPSDLRRHMQTDVQQAESVLYRIRTTAENAQKLLNCGDWRELEHFIDSNAALLHEKTVLALMQRREALIMQRSDAQTKDALRVSEPLSLVRCVRARAEETVGSGVPVVSLLRAMERDEEDCRRAVLGAEHAARVSCLRLEMNAMAFVLLSQMTRPFGQTVTGGDAFASTAATPDVSPIKSAPLTDSAPPVERQQTPVITATSPSAVFRGCRSSNEAVVDVLCFLPFFGALMHEEEICRQNIEGLEEFERNVFLFPMATRGILFGRVF